ncbi:MAG: GvpL/GvpF family gas vesicle protein [Candidatus Nitrosotenuis sp.]|nr:GvpL/GvpF family gas vesicle protein [Candidatus Nitrosotenuis sp.]
MTTGVYLYCIIDADNAPSLGNIGLYGKEVRAIAFKDLCAVISDMPFKEIHPGVDEINMHQNVVDQSRGRWVTLPVRFGTLFKNSEGLRQYMIKSYKELRPKIRKFKNKDEYGVKVIFDSNDLSKLKMDEDGNSEIRKIKKEMPAAGEGTSYFLKLRMDEAMKMEALRKIDEIRGDIHRQISKVAVSSSILRSDLAQIIMNSSYLIDRSKKDAFDSQVNKISEKYEAYGITVHSSGPWAPYSFC